MHVGGVDLIVCARSVSGALNESSSSSRSSTVCSRRAPIFSDRALTSAAISASAGTASSVKLKLHLLGLEQRDVLLGQRVLGFGQDADEVLAWSAP